MAQTLVIAEKPSVAGDIARALGGFKKDGEFWTRDDMIIGSAVGHLLEIKAPEEYDVKRGRWSFANLPVIPPYFDLQPIKKSESKYTALAKKSAVVLSRISSTHAMRGARANSFSATSFRPAAAKSRSADCGCSR